MIEGYRGLRILPHIVLLIAVVPLGGCLSRSRPVALRTSTAPLQTATGKDLIWRINAAATEIQTLKATVGITASVGGSKLGKIKEYGLADSGDTLKLGIGAMTDERIKSFYDSMVKAGVVAPGLDYRKGYTLQFVDKGVGLDLRPK